MSRVNKKENIVTKKPKSRIRFILYIFISGIFFVLMLELICRIFDPLGISYYPETAAYLDTMIHEEPIGYRNRPGLNGSFYGAPVHINSFGLRDREISLTKNENENRILILGDSTPFAIGMEYEKSFSYILENLINTNYKANKNYRTINMGTFSYNTEQQLIQLKTLGLKLEPDIVLLIYSYNDIQTKMWIFNRRNTWYNNLIQRSYAGSILIYMYKSIRGIIFKKPPNIVGMEEYDPQNPRWIVVDESLTEINKICRKKDIFFVVFTTNLQINPKAQELVNQVGKREGFPVVQLGSGDDPRLKKENSMKYRNSIVDGHPNEEGHELYAELIYERLIHLNVIQ